MNAQPTATVIPPRIYALIPCAGTGSRSGSVSPKQYRSVAGRPLVMHTLAAFAAVPRITQTLVVVAPEDARMVLLRLDNAQFSIANCGGSTRAQSVFNGLNWLIEAGASTRDWVLVHDAARCLIVSDWINLLIDNCLPDEVGGLLALPLPDTLKQALDARVVATLERHDKWLAQTPQMFRIGSLLDALEMAGETVTDESSAIEAMGLQPRLIPGSVQNFKVTYPQDFELAEAVLYMRKNGLLACV